MSTNVSINELTDLERYALIGLHEILRDAKGDTPELSVVRREAARAIDRACNKLAVWVGREAVDALLDEIEAGVFA